MIKKCRSCGKPIDWKLFPSTDKLHPYNLDGTSHFSTCPHAQRWRKRGKQKESPGEFDTANRRARNNRRPRLTVSNADDITPAEKQLELF